MKDVEISVVKNTDDIVQLREDVDELRDEMDELLESVEDQLSKLSSDLEGQAKDLKEVQSLVRDNKDAITKIKELEEQKMVFKKLGSVFFSLDSYKLSDQAKSSIHALKDAVSGYQGDLIFYVAGSASIEGTAQYNLILALRRAAAVKAYMKEIGIRGEVLVMTYGAESQDFSDKPNNRRADIYVTGQQ